MSEQEPRRPSVVVVGGGYGGIAAAAALDERADVVLVEPKDSFVHAIAALRAVVNADWLPRIFFPYDRLLARGRVLRDRAVAVEAGRVELASGAALTPDFVVLATGSSYPFPAKSDVDDQAEAMERFAAAREAIEKADHVLLVGAGPVGIELAGEINTVWPTKAITLHDLADDVMGPLFKLELKAELRRQLEDRGVRLLLGSPLTSLPPTEPGAFGAFTVTTEGGTAVTANVWFRCWGVTPVSDYLAGGLATARRADGFVEVTPEMLVAGQDRVFAVGDLTSGHAKMAAAASRQAAVVAANILAIVDGGELARFEPSGPGIAVPIGPDGGAGQFPGQDQILGPDVIARVKGQALNVERFAERFGIVPPDVV
ncbi:MAG: FAD-dependent oxidoreductase [Acidimicrobiia bacterium]